MKLIDLLIQELPGRGGWPDEINYMAQDSDDSASCRKIYGYVHVPSKCGGYWTDAGDTGYGRLIFRPEFSAEDCMECMVSREQYEAALAASKEMLINKPQPVWNGEGLPPVGQRCDFYSALEGRWLPVQIEAVTKDGVAFTWLTDELCYSGLDCVNTENALFRAPLSAEELARIGIIDNFIKIMAGYIDGGLKPEIMRERLYQHLPLLPGVKVEAPDA